MITVTAFKTSDGKIFEDSDEATKHERHLVLAARLEEFAKEHCYRDMSVLDFKDAMLSNAEVLREIFAAQ